MSRIDKQIGYIATKLQGPSEYPSYHRDIKKVIHAALLEVLPTIDPFLYDTERHISNATRGIKIGDDRVLINHALNMQYRAGQEHILEQISKNMKEMGL